jgi:hypothetical protein
MLPALQKRGKLFFSKDYFGKGPSSDCKFADKNAVTVQL